MTEDEKIQLVDNHVAALMEHFDAVQILVTGKPEKDPTLSFGLYRGAGNWYARQGLAQEFVDDNQAYRIGTEVGKNLQ